MATTEQSATVLGVLLVLIGVIAYNALVARRPAAAPAPPAAVQPWVGRYVQHEGDVLGQVVAVEGDEVIVRKGAVHLALPRAKVREQGLDLGVSELDPAVAQQRGEAWKARA